MRSLATLLTVTLMATALDALGCGDPRKSQFKVVVPPCSKAAPCLEDRALTLTFEAQRGCYPWWSPCAPYTISSCDTIEWDFGDGTKRTVGSIGSVSYDFPRPGWYVVRATIRNENGSATGVGEVLIAADPPSFGEFAKSRYEVSETAGSVSMALNRTGDLSRSASCHLLTGGGSQPFWRNLEVANNRPVTLAAGATSTTITLKVENDTSYNGEQVHSLALVCTDGNVVLPYGHVATTEVRITDDDKAPLLTLNDQRVTEGDEKRTISTRFRSPSRCPRTSSFTGS